MFCTNCGTENTGSAEFCKKCGQQLFKKEMKYAGFWIRFGAYFIDFIGILLTSILVGFILGFIGMYNQEIIDNMGILFDYAIWIIYSTFFLTMWSTTPGKKIYGLKVVTEDSKELDFASSLKRSILQPISLLFFGAGYWNMDKNAKKQTSHDKRAHTLVISVRKSNYIIPAILTFVGLIIYAYIRSLTSE